MQNHTIGLKLHTPYLEKPISAGRDIAKKTLLEKNKNSDRKLICVDGSAFTDKIEIINDEIIKNIDSVLLLPAGFDGIIAKTSEKVELALPVGDCGLLLAYHKDFYNSEKIMGNAHLGYKGVIADGDLEKNGIIENFLNALLNQANTKNFKEFEFGLAPMAGENFELPKDYFYTKISPFIKKQNKTIKSYFSLSPEEFIKKSPNGEDKVYFNLRALINYILSSKFGIFIKDEFYFKEDTTDPKNILSSYRSHTLSKNIPEIAFIDNRISGSDLNFLKGKKPFSEKTILKIQEMYDINREQALLLLYGNAEHYKNTNSRLSLNIFTK